MVPDIGAIATAVAQPESVGVSGGAMFEHEDQLMLRAIERSHASIGLVPDHHILVLGEYVSARDKQLAHMAPVHAGEGDGAVAHGPDGPKTLMTTSAPAHCQRGAGGTCVQHNLRQMLRRLATLS